MSLAVFGFQPECQPPLVRHEGLRKPSQGPPLLRAASWFQTAQKMKPFGQWIISFFHKPGENPKS
jgi:hypothetical protein